MASGFHSHWFTYWLTWLRPESSGGQTSRGQRLEVRWGSRIGVAGVGGGSHCVLTHMSSSASFPLASAALDYSAGRRGRRCSSLRGFEKWVAERKGGHLVDLGDAVLSQMGLQGWLREVSVHVKNEPSSPPDPQTALRDHSGLEPNHNKTQRHTDI